MTYLRNFQTRQTPQSEPIPGSSQVPNSAGGYAWAVDDWARLDRFLVLGSQNGTFYIGERKLTRDNADAVLRCIKSDGQRVVRRTVEISIQGRAPTNDPALFVLALALAEGDLPTRQLAAHHAADVARIGTHLFHFMEFVKGFRGRGRLVKAALQAWYQNRSLTDLQLQLAKYQQRDGWSHRDILRLARPRPTSQEQAAAYRWAVNGTFPEAGEKESDRARATAAAYEQYVAVGGVLNFLWAVDELQHAAAHKDLSRVEHLITEWRLPREVVPTELLNERTVWEALLPHMPITALVRNLGKMTSIGLLAPLSDAAKFAAGLLGNEGALRRSRIHPMQLLVAQKVYEQGHGDKGSLKWDPVPQLADALDAAFYASFGNVQPTGQRLVVAIDGSGSMTAPVHPSPVLTCRQAAVAMALVTLNAEPNTAVLGYTTTVREVAISPKQRLADAIRTFERQVKAEGTDCSLPMLWATEHHVEGIGGFLNITDSETWAGHKMHPMQALKQYRERYNPRAKLIVEAMASNGFTIADPNDAGALDIVGFDTSVPQVIAQFLSPERAAVSVDPQDE